MNLHENAISKGRGAKMNKGFKPGFMGPPLRLPPKKKSSTSSSSLNWGKSQTSAWSSSVFRSGGSSKSSTDDSEGRIVLALTEGRGEARCEVGLASINVPKATVVLCQISDTPSYINTLTKINILNPGELIIPATFADNSNKARLMDLIKQHFPVMRIVMFPRSSFNKSNGIDRLQYLCLPELKSLLLSLHYKYYALCAASAALIYVQNTLNVYYTADTLKLDYQESEGFAVIDVWTADRLELVSSTRPAQATKYSTLFGVLNNCMTKAGSRTLRSTILQPPCLPSIIEQRLKCVTELIECPEMTLAIKIILQKVSNIDQLLAITTMFPNDAQHCSYRQLNYLLTLNSVLDHIEPLRDVLNKAQEPFFTELRELLSSNDFNTLRDLVREMVHPDAHYAKGQAGDLQRCFIIKPGVNGLLDSVRKIYSERIEETIDYVKQLTDKYNLPLTLGNNNSKGYHIVLTLKGQQKRYLKKSDLPGEFIQVFRLSGSYTMKTLELINLSTRIDNVMMDIIKLSNLMIYKLLAGVKKYIGLFYRLCESIANLDMYQSLAQASIGSGCAKPIFEEFTDVRLSRHPMLEYLCSTRPIPNSFASCKYYNFHIITGPNGSGKSVFIRQVALLQIMAQVGCYLPAQSAHFRPADRIYARVYLEDNMECGASAFTLEMKEIKYIMTTMTANSLIIIDELCRSTSVEEGTALAMSICEKLCSSSAFVYVTTHYTLLTKLQQMYYNIKIWQMETEAFGDKPENTVLDFKYTVQPGVTSLERYGVYMVRNIWPDCLVKEIDKMIDEIRFAPKTANFSGLDEKLRLKYDLEATFARLKSQGKLTKAEINTHLNTYISELEKMDIKLAIKLNSEEQNRDFISNLQSNCILSQVSALDSLPDFSTDENWEPALADEMNFTPDMSDQRSLQSCDSGVLQQNRFFEPFIYNENLSSDSEYRHLSEFIAENSENLGKLVPDVILESSSRSGGRPPELSWDYTNMQTPNRADAADMMTALSDAVVSPCRSDQSCVQARDLALQQSYQERPFFVASSSDHPTCIDNKNYTNVCNNGEFSQRVFQMNILKLSTVSGPSMFLNKANHSSQDQSSSNILNMNISEKMIDPVTFSETQFCERSSFQAIKTPLKCTTSIDGSCVNNNTAFYDKINEAIEDLNSCSDSFFEEDMDFTESSYNSAINQEVLPVLCVSDVEPNDTINGEGLEISNKNNTIISNQNQFLLSQENDNSITNCQKNDDIELLQHIFPKVIIREGRDDISKSFGQEGSDAEEIYYSALESDDNNENNESSIPVSKLWNLPIKNNPSVAVKHSQYTRCNEIKHSNEEINENSGSESSQNLSYHSMLANIDKSSNMAENLGTENTITERHSSLSDKDSAIHNDICPSTVRSDATELGLEKHGHSSELDDDRELSKKTLQSCSTKCVIDNNSSSCVIECCNSTESNPESVSNLVSLRDESNISSNKFQEKTSDGYEGMNQPCEDNNDIADKIDQTVMETQTENSTFACNKSEDTVNNHKNEYESTTQTKENKEQLIVENTKVKETEVEYDYTNIVNNIVNASITITDSARENKDISNLEEDDLFSETSLPGQNNETTKQSTSTSSIRESTSSPNPVRQKESIAVKRKFKPPRQIDSSSTPSDDILCKQKPKRLKPASKFIPPKKLTKREIIEALDKQNRILIEEAERNPEDSSKYLKKWLNTPSVSQIQNATILTHMRKTEEGIIEIPTGKLQKRQRKAKFLPSLRSTSSERCDVSIFSDKNAVPFQEFLKSKEKDYKLFNFDFKKDDDFRLLPSQSCDGVHSHRSPSLPPKRCTQKRSWCDLTVENVQLLTHQEKLSINLSATKMSLTPDGYYKQNKSEIETLINKYARKDDYGNMMPVYIPSQKKSIFEETTSGEFNL